MRCIVVCQGFHDIPYRPRDVPAEKPHIYTDENIVGVGWRLVSDPLFDPNRVQSWLCPDCVERYKNHLRLNVKEAREEIERCEKILKSLE